LRVVVGKAGKPIVSMHMGRISHWAHQGRRGTGCHRNGRRSRSIEDLEGVVTHLRKIGISINTGDAQHGDVGVAGCVEDRKRVINTGVNIKNHIEGHLYPALFSRGYPHRE
jgi:hypothetical protein